MGKRASYNREESIFDEEFTESQTEKKEEPAEVKSEKKVFDDKDKIPCLSITVGVLAYIGEKSGEVYVWQNIGDVVEVEYRDLMTLVRTNSPFVFEPRFIIQDEDFLAQNDAITLRYGQMYTPQDIEYVLSLPAPQLEENLKKMPVGAQNALRDVAVRKIDSGELDSVQRVKVLDSFFGTELVLKLTK